MQVTRRIASDNELRTLLNDGHPYVTLQFISSDTPHRDTIDSLLLDPSCGRHIAHLHVEHKALSASEALQAAQDVRSAALRQHSRERAPRKHRFAFAPVGSAPRSNVYVDVHEYAVPVGYRVLGIVGPGDGASSEHVFGLRVVWERHCFASLGGQIVRHRGQFSQRDAAIVSAVQELQGKRSEHAGDPLPIALALAILLSSDSGGGGGGNGGRGGGPAADDLRDLVLADEVATDVDVVDFAVGSDEVVAPAAPAALASRPICEDDVSAALATAMQCTASAPALGTHNNDDDNNDDDDDDGVRITFRGNRK